MSEIPGPILKRDILFGVKKTTASELQTLAKTLESAEWLSDALDFFDRAKDESAVRAIRQKSVQEGNVFLFLKCSRLLADGDAGNADLLKCGENAESQGKFRYALKAYEKLELADRVETIRALVAQDGDMLAEATVFIPENEEEFLEDAEDDA